MTKILRQNSWLVLLEIPIAFINGSMMFVPRWLGTILVGSQRRKMVEKQSLKRGQI